MKLNLKILFQEKGWGKLAILFEESLIIQLESIYKMEYSPWAISGKWKFIIPKKKSFDETFLYKFQGRRIAVFDSLNA